MAKGTSRATTRNWAQVAPLIPLALFASAFTVSATDDPAIASASLQSGGHGEPVVVPAKPFADPANYPIPGGIGNGVDPNEQPTQVVSGLSRNGIPQAALKAYSRAQQVMSTADASCQLPWTLVAAIGRVESNHGRHGGNALNGQGLAVPGIFGPRLDGMSTARITDTDGGRLDGDQLFDRAVGPMQFIPGTWKLMGVDGDGDGTKNPQDIDDAAMSTAVYLCSGKVTLTKAGDLNAALLRYNHSQAYVDLVISIAKAYAGGSWVAVDNSTREGDGVDRAGDELDRVDIDPPVEQWDKAIVSPTPPVITTGTKPPSTRPTTTPTRTITKPSTRPTSSATPTPKPTTPRPTTTSPTKRPTTPQVTPKPPTIPGAAVIQTAAGTIVGTVGSTVAEVTNAANYCQAEMAKVTIKNPTQEQLQKCVTAFQTGGTKAVDQAIRNLLSLLGLLGVLGGGILGN
ncbi:lytic transglycosylase domain-containing protein [Kribbella deserti]|uniref:Lytic transglycosylase domain-containing protein n=1 Tax=Kribbella deserti TaxID=1926257 RepID=A0ABV6QXG2_9ACTN